MRERLLPAATALVRLVLVVVAFGLAAGSIGLSAVRGFCPEVEDAALAMASRDAPLAVVEPPSDDAPDDPDAVDPDGEEAPAEDGPCPGQAPRCLPPLLSSILLVGDPICHEQAGSRLRGILVPAFVGSTILLAGAWWLRPARLQARTARTDRDRVAP